MAGAPCRQDDSLSTLIEDIASLLNWYLSFVKMILDTIIDIFVFPMNNAATKALLFH